MSNFEYQELSNKLNQVLNLVELLVPPSFTLPYIAETTGANRETIYKYLTRNYIENMDFWKKDDKIFLSRDVGLELIRRYKKC